jgi:Flp pilus assembly pilin Flp
MHLKHSLLRWTEDQSGQDLTEYAFILAFVVLALVAELGLFGLDLQALYRTIIGAWPPAY